MNTTEAIEKAKNNPGLRMRAKSDSAIWFEFEEDGCPNYSSLLSPITFLLCENWVVANSPTVTITEEQFDTACDKAERSFSGSWREVFKKELGFK